MDDILIVSWGEFNHEVILESLLPVVQKVKHTGKLTQRKGKPLLSLEKRSPESLDLTLSKCVLLSQRGLEDNRVCCTPLCQ